MGGAQYFGMVLAWCGDAIFQHAALLKAIAQHKGNPLGILRPIFRICTQPLDGVVASTNVFEGLLSDQAVAKNEEQRRVKLSDDQRAVLRALGRSKSAVLKVEALVGTGEDVAVGLHAGCILAYHSEHGQDCRDRGAK